MKIVVRVVLSLGLAAAIAGCASPPPPVYPDPPPKKQADAKT